MKQFLEIQDLLLETKSKFKDLLLEAKSKF